VARPSAGHLGAARGPDGVARTIETNFFGPLRVTFGLLPLLCDGATITNVTSGLGALENLDHAHRRLLADPVLTRDDLVAHMREFVRTGGDGRGTDAYGASKAALNALTRVLAKELAPRQIRVNATCPGWVRTDMGGRSAPRSVEEVRMDPRAGDVRDMGGRSAPRSVEEGAASVLFGVTATETGGVFRDGRRIAP
jgi:NAD(P)-dependent dehydrogenase (short-subunit alcohol dehydrogenase family)